MKHDFNPCDHEVYVAMVLELLELRECTLGCEEEINAFIEPVVQLADDGRDVLLHDVLEERVEYAFFFEPCFELCLLLLQRLIGAQKVELVFREGVELESSEFGVELVALCECGNYEQYARKVLHDHFQNCDQNTIEQVQVSYAVE